METCEYTAQNEQPNKQTNKLSKQASKQTKTQQNQPDNSLNLVSPWLSEGDGSGLNTNLFRIADGRLVVRIQK